jgi:hypothetical protein
MSVYRHKNGGGVKVYPAQASPDSFIDRHSSVEGESGVYDCALYSSALKDTFAYRSTVTSSAVADCRVAEADITGSDLVSCEAGASTIEGCRLTDCRVFADGPAVPALGGVRLVGVTVYGEVSLFGPWGLELPGAHIHAGHWSEQPRHLLVEGDGIHVAVVECTEGRAHMGCECRPVTHWLEKGPRLARRLDWSEEQIETCLTFLRSLA